MTPLKVSQIYIIMGPYQKDIILPLKVNRFVYHQIGKRYHDMEMKNDYDMIVGEARCQPQEVRRVATQCRGYHYLIVDFGLKYGSCKSGLARTHIHTYTHTHNTQHTTHNTQHATRNTPHHTHTVENTSLKEKNRNLFIDVITLGVR
jgi:hypothetical protein